MVRINEEKDCETPTAKESENHCPFIDRLDTLPETELVTKEDALQLITYCYKVYDYWMNYQEEFSCDHETRIKRRQTLLSLSLATRVDHEHSTKDIDDIYVVDL